MLNSVVEMPMRLEDNKINPAFAEARHFILQPSFSVKRFYAISFDILAAMLTVWMAFSLRFELWHSPVGNQWLIYLLAPVLMIPVFIYAGLYRVVYRHSGFSAFITLIQASAAYGLLFICVLFFLNVPGVPHSIGVLQPMISLLIIGGSRGFVKFWYINNDIKEQKGVVKEKLIIYGAGSAGVEIMNAINRSKKYDLVGFVDDEKQLHGRTINGMKVYSFTQAEDLIVQQGISNILLAMPSVSRVRRSEIVNKFKKFPVHIQMLPGFEELVDGRVSISDIKEIQIEDLLGRDPVPVNNALVNEIIEGRVVLVTGAGGSIGSELCRQLLAANPSKLLLVDNAEHNLYIINNDLQRRRLRINSITEVVPLLGDVTDENRMAEICSVFEPSVIYHAAAYKHVPMVEHNPVQGVRNNVLGTLTVAEVALQYGVSSVVLVSTDKAVRPTNVMGASKRFCEMIFQALAEELGHSTCFSMVRFGNVLGSSGSVVPLFRQQIKEGGPLTITHEEITRYFMTIPEAAQLIIQAGAMASGGDVYLLDMGEPIKIVDLARRMVELSGLSVRDIEFSYTGLRPGEKLYEELLIGNNPEPTQNSRIFKANEDFVAWPKLLRELGELTFAISNNDVDSIKRHLMRLIPEYQTNSKTTDYVALEQKNQCLNIALCA